MFAYSDSPYLLETFFSYTPHIKLDSCIKQVNFQGPLNVFGAHDVFMIMSGRAI